MHVIPYAIHPVLIDGGKVEKEDVRSVRTELIEWPERADDPLLTLRKAGKYLPAEFIVRIGGRHDFPGSFFRIKDNYRSNMLGIHTDKDFRK